MPKLYVAYGSNLHKQSMRRRCPYSKPLGKFYLTDARLVFRGVADVEYSLGDKVPCALWSINRSDEHALDQYEGVSSGMYYKEEGIVLKFAGRPQNALIYLMRSDGIYPPSEHYANIIRKGYQDFKLDESYLDAAIERAFLYKTPDEQTVERRERQLGTKKQARLVQMPEAVALRRLEIKESYNHEHD